MASSSALLESIPQSKYLSADNYTRYRAIMRLFYHEYEKMNYQMDKETILTRMKENPVFAEYDYPDLIADLDQLTAWKNLTPIQDPHKPRTVADFKNRQFQYMISQAALEIERMTITLENLSTRTAGLSSSAFRRIYEALGEIHTLEHAAPRDVGVWWQDIKHDFDRLSQNHQDYLREFYGPGAERHMKSIDFIAHKQNLIRYLEEFIQELQSSSVQIAARLEKIQPEQIERMLALVHQSELDIPRPQSEQRPGWEEALRVRNQGVWQSLTDWFVGPTATANQVMEVTNEIIRRVVQNAALLVQMQNLGVSNKAELRHFLTLFASCGELNDAHRLSSQLFGIQSARHYTVNAPRETERIDSSAYEEPPLEYLVQPRVRTYQARVDKSGFPDRSAEKEAQRQRILEEQRAVKREVLSCIKDGVLSFDGIGGPVSPQARNVLLSWVAMANLSPDRRGRTEYGQVYTLRRKGAGVCRLPCTDGVLTLPNEELVFEEKRL